MKKLKLKHLAPYLPYGITFKGKRKGWVHYCNDIMHLCIDDLKDKFDEIKPILRPLTDIYNLIEIDGDLFTPHEQYDELFGPNDDYLFEVMNKENGICIEDIPNLPYYVIEWLISLHFDVFGLIEKGLAIDINTLK